MGTCYIIITMTKKEKKAFNSYFTAFAGRDPIVNTRGRIWADSTNQRRKTESLRTRIFFSVYQAPNGNVRRGRAFFVGFTALSSERFDDDFVCSSSLSWRSIIGFSIKKNLERYKIDLVPVTRRKKNEMKSNWNKRRSRLRFFSFLKNDEALL